MTDSKEWCDGDWRWRWSSRPFAGAESGSPGRALEAGERGSPGRAVQAGIRGKRLKKVKLQIGIMFFLNLGEQTATVQLLISMRFAIFDMSPHSIPILDPLWSILE